MTSRLCGSGKTLTALFLFSLLQTASTFAATWYVAPTGSDTNTGALAAPFASIAQAQAFASSGDTVYLRGGTYTNFTIAASDANYNYVHNITKSGISYLAYPGDARPVLDFSNISPAVLRVCAFRVTGSNNTFQGFDLTGIQAGNQRQCDHWRISGNGNTLYLIVNRNDQGNGVYIMSPGSNNLIENCDSYDLIGIIGGDKSAGNTDGFGCHSSGSGNVFRGCRAWACSDDGYDCINNSGGGVTFEYCWAYDNGRLDGNKTGFKIGGFGCSTGAFPNPPPVHTVRFCLSANNGANGFYANHQPGQAANWYNNTAYNNAGANFNMLEAIDTTPANCSVAGTREILHNNLSYVGTLVNNLNQSGNSVASNSWTLGVTVNGADFQSVDPTQMTQPRKPDGSLPDIAFMHLVSGSDLIDTGMDLGFAFNGAAPDLGAFEFAATPSVTGLVWKGDGVANVWDVNTTTNWLNGTNASVFVSGAAVTFDDTGTNSPPVNLVGVLLPGTVTVSAAQNYVLTGSGSLSGSMPLIKSGAGQLILTTTNGFNGGVTLNLGTLVLSNTLAAGTGTLTLNGGTLSLTASGAPAIYANPFNLAATSTLATPGSGNNNQASSGTWSSNATLNVNTGAGGTFSVQGNMANFSGMIVLMGAGTFRFYNNCTGSGSAAFDLGTSTALMQTRDGGPVNLGALSGGAGTILRGAGSSANPTTYFIGGKSVDSTYSGTISNGSFSTGPAPTSIAKVGSGTLTLTGTNNYSGGTTVSNGTLLVNNTSGSGTGTGAVTVASGGTLGGTGIVAGPVTVNGTLAPVSSVGTLTIGNNLVVNGGAVLAYELGALGDLAVVTGNLTLGGTLNVTDSGGFSNGTYTLFTYGGTLTYNGVAIGPAPGGYNYSVSTSTPGQVKLVVLTPFQTWQMQYFSCTDCPQAAAAMDPDGDGMSNTNEFLAGTNPTNSLSGLRIISVLPQGDGLNVTWTTAGGRTNAVQATAGDAGGGYSNGFVDITIAPHILIDGSGDTTTNYVDSGGATNLPSRYYRIRLVP